MPTDLESRENLKTNITFLICLYPNTHQVIPKSPLFLVLNRAPTPFTKSFARASLRAYSVAEDAAGAGQALKSIAIWV